MKKLALILLVVCTHYAQGQVNLVPNGSFEVIDTCGFSFDNFEILQNWFKPSIATTDVFNACASGGGGDVPINSFGFQYANHGNGYTGILLMVTASVNYREYAAIKLLDYLKSNTFYCLKYFVSLSDEFPLNISSIGAYFSPDSLYQNNLLVLPYFPQIENPDTNFINDTTSWKLISGYFKAVGGEKYMYIGNFKDDENTITQNLTPGARSYVYIDNVQLYECDSITGIEENPVDTISIFPNPAQGFVSVVLPQPTTQAQLHIYNLTGQLILQQPITSNQPIPITELSNGMYIFVVQNGDRFLGRQRVVVER